jgi:hypothetical protein
MKITGKKTNLNSCYNLVNGWQRFDLAYKRLRTATAIPQLNDPATDRYVRKGYEHVVQMLLAVGQDAHLQSDVKYAKPSVGK